MHDLRFLSAFLFLLEIAGCIHNLHQPPSVSLFSTLLPPSFFSLHLLFSLLAIWLLQLCSLAYCRMCRCHQKLFTFQRFDAVSLVYKLHCRHLAQLPKTKAEAQGLLLLKWAGVIMRRLSVWRVLSSSFTPITSSITSAKGFWHCDDDWWSVSSQSRFKWTLNIHAVRVKTEYIIFMLFKG